MDIKLEVVYFPEGRIKFINTGVHAITVAYEKRRFENRNIKLIDWLYVGPGMTLLVDELVPRSKLYYRAAD
jgi:hypothetical protein